MKSQLGLLSWKLKTSEALTADFGGFGRDSGNPGR